MPDSSALRKLEMLKKQKCTPLFCEAKMLSILLKRFKEENDAIIKYLQTLNPERYSTENLLNLRNYLSETGKIDEYIIDKLLNFNTHIQPPDIFHKKSLPFELVDIHTLAESPFKRMIGRTSDIYILNDAKKIQELVNILQTPDWHKNEILEYPYFLYIALAACKDGLITPIQYSTLSQIIELRKRYGKENIAVYNLLDENKQFTPEAENYLFRHFQDSRINNIQSTYKNKIWMLEKNITKLPYTEQIFVTIERPEEEIGLNHLFYPAFRNVTVFGDSYDNHGALFSTGAFQEFINITYPNHPVQISPRLGPVSREDIEMGLRNDMRIVSIYYPHYKTGKPSQNPHFYHGEFVEATSIIGLHDRWHIIFASIFSKEQMNFDFCCIDTNRSYTNNKWSLAIWKSVDHAEYSGSESYGERYDIKNAFGFLENCFMDENLDHSEKYSPEIAILLFDMGFLNCEKWKEYNISQQSLEEVMGKCHILKKYYHKNYFDESYFCKNDPVHFNLLKLNILFNYSGSSTPLKSEEIKKIFNSLDIHKEKILSNIVLKKEVVETPNHHYLRLYWNGKLLSSNDLISISTKQEDIKDISIKEVIPFTFLGGSHFNTNDNRSNTANNNSSQIQNMALDKF